MPHNESDLLAPEEAGAYLGGAAKPIKVQTMAKWRCEGGGPAYQTVGRLIRYRSSDLDAWLATRRRDNTSQRAA